MIRIILEFICFFLSMFLRNFSQSFRAGALPQFMFFLIISLFYLYYIGHDLIVIKNVKKIILLMLKLIATMDVAILDFGFLDFPG